MSVKQSKFNNIFRKNRNHLSINQKINSSIHLIKAGKFELLPSFDSHSGTKRNFINIALQSKMNFLANANYLTPTYQNIEHSNRVSSKKKEIYEMLSDRNYSYDNGIRRSSYNENNKNSLLRMNSLLYNRNRNYSNSSLYKDKQRNEFEKFMKDLQK